LPKYSTNAILSRAPIPNQDTRLLVLKHDELSGPSSRKQVHDKKYNDKKKERKDAGVALAPKILEPKKSPILIFCRQFSNIEVKLWFHFFIESIS
jgi:hypothetical protein